MTGADTLDDGSAPAAGTVGSDGWQPAPPISPRAGRWTALGVGLFGLAWVALGSATGRGGGWVTIALAALVWLASRPHVRFSPEGLTVVRYRTRTIPWSEVASFEVLEPPRSRGDFRTPIVIVARRDDGGAIELPVRVDGWQHRTRRADADRRRRELEEHRAAVTGWPVPDGDPSPVLVPLSSRLAGSVLRIGLVGQVAGSVAFAAVIATANGAGPPWARRATLIGLVAVAGATRVGVGRAIRHEHPLGDGPDPAELMTWSGLRRATVAAGRSWPVVRAWLVVNAAIVLCIIAAATFR